MTAFFFLAIDPNTRWYATLVLLTVALVGGMIWAFRVWEGVKGVDNDSSADPDDILFPLADAFAAGQMSEEEYKRIKESIRRGVPSDLPVATKRPKLGASGEPAQDASA